MFVLEFVLSGSGEPAPGIRPQAALVRGFAGKRGGAEALEAAMPYFRDAAKWPGAPACTGVLSRLLLPNRAEVGPQILLTEDMLEDRTLLVEVDSATPPAAVRTSSTPLDEGTSTGTASVLHRAPVIRPDLTLARAPKMLNRAFFNVAKEPASFHVKFAKRIYNLADLVGGAGLLPNDRFDRRIARLEPLSEQPVTEARLLEAISENMATIAPDAKSVKALSDIVTYLFRVVTGIRYYLEWFGCSPEYISTAFPFLDVSRKALKAAVGKGRDSDADPVPRRERPAGKPAQFKRHKAAHDSGVTVCATLLEQERKKWKLATCIEIRMARGEWCAACTGAL